MKLRQTWESYLTELPKLPWTSLYLTSLELENCDEDMKERVLYALNYGPCGLKTSSLEIHKDDNTEEVMNVDPIEVQCPGNVVRKKEKRLLEKFTFSFLPTPCFYNCDLSVLNPFRTINH